MSVKRYFINCLKKVDANIRIEKIGKFYVIRLGVESTVKNLIPYLSKLKNLGFSSAFIRNAFYIPNRIILESSPPISIKQNLHISKEKLSELLNLIINAYTYAGELDKAEAIAEKAVNLYPYNWWFLKKIWGDTSVE